MTIHFGHVLRAELIKSLGVRSIRVTLAAALFVPAALALASGMAVDPGRKARFPVESHGFETAGFGQPLIILLAALIMGIEFRDGLLRTTLLTHPGRGTVFAAKFVIIGGLAGLIGVSSIALAVFLKHAALGEQGLAPGEFTAEMLWNLLGVGLNFALIALIAASLTMLSRSIVAALVVLIPLVLGLTISLLGVIPALKFLPDLAGIQLLMRYPEMKLLEPLPGAIIMCLWAAGLAVIALLIFRKRDISG